MKFETNNDSYATSSNMFNIHNETARGYRKAGEFHKAINIYTKIVSANLRTYGANHMITLRSISRLANTHYASGDYEKALDLFSLVCQKRVEKLGKNDPNTLRSMTSIANCYSKLELFKQSADLHREVIELTNNILITQNSRTLLSKKRLSQVLEQLKHFG